MAHVKRPEDTLQSIFSLGDDHHMDVIGHQAVGQYFHAVLLGVVL